MRSTVDLSEFLTVSSDQIFFFFLDIRNPGKLMHLWTFGLMAVARCVPVPTQMKRDSRSSLITTSE